MYGGDLYEDFGGEQFDGEEQAAGAFEVQVCK